MKINSLNTAVGHYRKRSKDPSLSLMRESAFKRTENNLKQNNNDQINTTIKSNSDGRVNFKGGVPLLHKVAGFVDKNPLVAEALFAIVITCGLRPLSIMATAKTEEDKEKCSYQAAKSVSSGLVGLGMTALVATPLAKANKIAQQNKAYKMPPEMKEKSKAVVKEGIEALEKLADGLVREGKDASFAIKIKNLIHGDKLNLNVLTNSGKNAEKIFKEKIEEKAPEISEKVANAIKEQTIINNYADTAKNVADKFFQPVFMPLRATVTVAMVPVLLGLIGKKKPASKPKEEENPFKSLNYNVLQNQNDEKVFHSFAGVAKYENK